MTDHLALTPASVMDQELYILADPEDGALIGVDEPSGGYPFKPFTFLGVKIWSAYETAERYARPSSIHPKGLRILRLHAILTETEESEDASA